MLNLAFMGMQEWLIVLAVVLVLFGSSRLPALARSLGSSITEFKKGIKDDSAEKIAETAEGEEKSST